MHDDAIYEKPMTIIKIILLIIVIGLVIWFMAGVIIKHKEAKIYIKSKTGVQTFTASIAETYEARAQGLSGTKYLAPDSALLMIFPHDDNWGIWMKDMNYPIDVVWLNSSYEVVHIEQSMHPNSYPRNIYKPKNTARYVIEFPAATTSRSYLKIGSKVKIDIR